MRLSASGAMAERRGGCGLRVVHAAWASPRPHQSMLVGAFTHAGVFSDTEASILLVVPMSGCDVSRGFQEAFRGAPILY